MKEQIFEDYIDLKNREESLLKKKDELKEKYINPVDLEIKEISDKKEALSEEILSEMSKHKETSHDCGVMKIIKAERSTLTIVDESLVIKNLFSPSILKKVEQFVDKKTFSKLREKLVIITEKLNKKPAMEIIESLKTVEGIEVEGTEVKHTEYLMVK